MSKKHHDNDVFHDIETLSLDELSNLYGIEFDGHKIYDPIEGRKFENLQEWAIHFNEVNNEINSYSKMSKKFGDWDYDDY